MITKGQTAKPSKIRCPQIIPRTKYTTVINSVINVRRRKPLVRDARIAITEYVQIVKITNIRVCVQAELGKFINHTNFVFFAAKSVQVEKGAHSVASKFVLVANLLHINSFVNLIIYLIMIVIYFVGDVVKRKQEEKNVMIAPIGIVLVAKKTNRFD